MHDPRPTTHVVIIGGGIAGALAAAALAPHSRRVTLLDRDTLPDSPVPRRGLPQARHAHVLWSGGARAIEALLPGTHDLWKQHGAHRIPIPQGMVSLAPAGWFRRWHHEQSHHYAIGASRDLTDWIIRHQLVYQHLHVEFRTQCTPVRLVGDQRKVRGLEVRDHDGTVEMLNADVVVDATGRAAAGGALLAELGIHPVAETRIDAGIVYASRRYKAPSGADSEWPIIGIQADPSTGEPGGIGTIIPAENGEWIVSLSGTRGHHPNGDSTAFEDFARTLRHPLAADFLRRAEPSSDVILTRSTPNVRRHYDKARMPAGFLVIGDAATACNPIYGHGMSSAARSALALHQVASELDITQSGFTKRAQKAIAKEADAAWVLATGQDIFFSDVEAPAPPSLADRAASWYVNALMTAAIGSHDVVQRFTDVMMLEKPATHLITPSLIMAALRGPRMPKLEGPALTPREQSVLKAAEPA